MAPPIKPWLSSTRRLPRVLGWRSKTSGRSSTRHSPRHLAPAPRQKTKTGPKNTFTRRSLQPLQPGDPCLRFRAPTRLKLGLVMSRKCQIHPASPSSHSKSLFGQVTAKRFRNVVIFGLLFFLTVLQTATAVIATTMKSSQSSKVRPSTTSSITWRTPRSEAWRMLTSKTVTLKQKPPAFVYVARPLMVMTSPSSLGKWSRRLLRETVPTGSATSAAVPLTAHKEVTKYLLRILKSFL